jgi:hypothetical protein
MDWHRTDPLNVRRANALRAHDGDELATAQALQQIANVTQHKPTKKSLKFDADYFFRMHNTKMGRLHDGSQILHSNRFGHHRKQHRRAGRLIRAH